MSARATKNWLAWLLPLFVLRAFIPAGFMLSWAGSELRVVICAGSGPAAPLSAPVEHSAHTHHEHHAQVAQQGAAGEHHDHAGAQAHEGSYCPFAIAGAATLPVLALTVAAEPPPSETFDFIADPQPRSAAVLIDRIRGPPLA